MFNFTWWVNRKDLEGSNLFEGGFLGLDNIGVFDRSAPLPTGGYLEQADGTAWMALFCQNMLEIAAQLALDRPAYVHDRRQVRRALPVDRDLDDARRRRHRHVGRRGRLLLRRPAASRRSRQRLKVRSLVGLLPLCAVTAFDGELVRKYPEMGERMRRFIEGRPELRAFIHDPVKSRRGRAAGWRPSSTRPKSGGCSPRCSTRRVPEPLRHPVAVAISRRPPLCLPRRRPGVPRRLPAGRVGHRHVRRELQLARPDLDARQRPDHPGAAPVPQLLRRCVHGRVPDRLGPADDALPGRRGDRPPARPRSSCATRGPPPGLRGHAKFQDDPQWRDLVLFYEYFHGDNGAGLGASHQTGWTGVIARGLHVFATMTGEQFVSTTDRVILKASARDPEAVANATQA